MANDKVTIDFEANLSKLQSQLAGLAGVVASAFAFSKMIESATEAEDAVNKLNIAMQMQGSFTEEASESFQRYSAHLQATTGYSDDLINANASLLVSMGQLSSDGLKRATDAALDLSAATGKDLNTTFTALAKAADGSVAGLAKYGIRVDESVPKSERFAAALRQIQANMGGMAEGRLNTFSGALNRLSLAFGDIVEELGKLITQSPQLRGVLNFISMHLEKLAVTIQALGSQGFADRFVEEAISIGRALNTFIIGPLEFLWNMAKIVFNGINTLAAALVSAVGGIIHGFADLANDFGLVSDETLEKARIFSDSSFDVIKENAVATKDAFTEGFNFDATTATENFLTSLDEFLAGITPGLDKFKTTVKNGTDGAATAAQENAKKIDAAFNAGIVNSISGAIQKIATNLAQGKNLFDNFGKTILGLLGDLAIQVGTVILSTGIAYASLGDFTGTSPIMYGAALIALGAILKSFAGGGAAPTPVGGNVATTGPGTSEFDASSGTGIDGAEPRRQGPGLVVNIEGNVLDRRQTGLEIAEVIQETFGSNGLVFNT